MLRAPFRGRRLQKRTEAQWDMRPWLRADGGANESMSLQLGITSSIGCQLEHDAPELHFQPTALSKAESTVCPKQKRTPSMDSTTFTDNCSGLRRPKDCMIFWLRPERSLSIPGF